MCTRTRPFCAASLPLDWRASTCSPGCLDSSVASINSTWDLLVLPNVFLLCTQYCRMVMGVGQRKPAAEQAADGGNTEMGLTLCSPELRHRTPRIPFLIDERPHRECHSPKCFFPSIATSSYGWCISGSLSPHRDSWACRINSRGSQALLAGFCRTPLPGLGLYAEPVEFSQPLSGSDMIDPPWRQGGGPMSNGCGVSGYAVGKVSVSLAQMGDTHLQRLSFSTTRSLSVVPTPVCGRARHCRPQQLRRVQSSSRGVERRRIHSTLSPHTTSNRPAERSSTANLPIRPVDVVPFLARHHTWPPAMTTGRRDYQSLNPATNNLCHRDGKMSKVILPLLKGRNMLFSATS